MARNIMREERPLARTLHDAAPEYKDGLVVKIEISSAKSVRPILLSGHNVQDFELTCEVAALPGHSASWSLMMWRYAAMIRMP